MDSFYHDLHYQGLPEDWEKKLSQSGLTKSEIIANPANVINVLTFLSNWEKVHADDIFADTGVDEPPDFTTQGRLKSPINLRSGSIVVDRSTRKSVGCICWHGKNR